MITAELSIVVVGAGTSMGKYIRAAEEALRKTKIRIMPSPMGTNIEARTIDEILAATKDAHQAALDAGAKRVLTTLRIDDRKDKDATLDSKLAAIK